MAKRREKLKVSKRGGKRWSARVTRESDALTLEKGVFPMPNARKSAFPKALGRPQPAAQSKVPARQCRCSPSLSTGAAEVFPGAAKQKLEKAKDELRKLYRNKNS